MAALFRREAEFGSSLLQGFDEQEDIGRAAAGNGGHAVDPGFIVDPHRGAHRLQDAVSRSALFGGYFRQGAQAGNAGADQGRRVGHAADDGAMAAQPARQRSHVEAGGDADDQCVAELVDERCDGFLHLLRLDGEDQDVRRRGGGIGAGVAGDAVAGSQLGTCVRTEVDHVDVAGREALLHHAADQGVGHVAAAEENNFHA